MLAVKCKEAVEPCLRYKCLPLTMYRLQLEMEKLTKWLRSMTQRWLWFLSFSSVVSVETVVCLTSSVRENSPPYPQGVKSWSADWIYNRGPFVHLKTITLISFYCPHFVLDLFLIFQPTAGFTLFLSIVWSLLCNREHVGPCCFTATSHWKWKWTAAVCLLKVWETDWNFEALYVSVCVVCCSGVPHSVPVSEIISVREEEEESSSRRKDDGSWKKIKERDGQVCRQTFTGKHKDVDDKSFVRISYFCLQWQLFCYTVDLYDWFIHIFCVRADRSNQLISGWLDF